MTTMRTTVFLSCFLLLSAVIWAQGEPMQPAPAPGNPAGSQGGMMANPSQPHTGGPEMAWQQPGGACGWEHHRRSVRIVGLILHVIVALSAAFALTALGIFLIRRSTPRL
jgi:hypothetical protein